MNKNVAKSSKGMHRWLVAGLVASLGVPSPLLANSGLGAATGILGGALVGSLLGPAKNRGENALIGAVVGGVFAGSLAHSAYGHARDDPGYEWSTVTLVSAPRTVQSVPDTVCRKMQVEGTINGKSEILVGTACRSGNGKWVFQDTLKVEDSPPPRAVVIKRPAPTVIYTEPTVIYTEPTVVYEPSVFIFRRSYGHRWRGHHRRWRHRHDFW